MCEIIFVIWFGLKLAKMANAKGRSGAWGLLGAGMWFGAEVFGVVLFMVILDMETLGYLAGIGCAIVSAFVSYHIVNSLEPVGWARDDDDSFSA